MKEYCIYSVYDGGHPFILKSYNNIDSAKQVLFELVSLEEERGRPYFVDNDFFNNKFAHVNKLKYFCIKESEVSEWEKYSEEENTKLNSNKIIFLFYFGYYFNCSISEKRVMVYYSIKYKIKHCTKSKFCAIGCRGKR